MKAGSQVRHIGFSSLFARPDIERVWLPNGQPKIGPVALIELDLSGWGVLQVSASGQRSEVRFKSWLWPGRHKIELAVAAHGWVDVSCTNLFGASRSRLQLESAPAIVEPRMFSAPQLRRSSILALQSFGAIRWRESLPLLRAKPVELHAKVIPVKARPIEMPKLTGFGSVFKPGRLRAQVQSDRFSPKLQAGCASPVQLDVLLHESPSNSDSHPKES